MPASTVAALAIGLLAAPSAGAESNQPSCRASGSGTVCNKQGHSSLHSKPVMPTGQSQLMHPGWLPGYGRGPVVPVWAYD